MSKAFAPALDSSYIYSLISQLGLGLPDEFSDSVTTFLTEFKTSDGQLLVENPGPFAKDDEPIRATADQYLSSFGDYHWPSYAKDARYRWPLDKEKILDLVSTIFVEKHRLYWANRNKDLNVDTVITAPQPATETKASTSVDKKDATSLKDPISEDAVLSKLASNDPQIPEDSASLTAKREPTALDEQEDGAIHLLTSRNRGSARISTAKTVEPATSNVLQSLLPSPVRKPDDETAKPHRFLDENAYRKGILDALDRAKSRGEDSLVGAIQYVRTTLDATMERDAIAGPDFVKKIGSVRLVKLNERYMAWVFERQDGSCFWVKPYKGKVTNGVVRYSGWTGKDKVFTSYPVTYGIISKVPSTPGKEIKDKEPPGSVKSRATPRLSSGMVGSKIVNLKLGRRNTEPKSEALETTPREEGEEVFPPYISGESWTMERAKAAVKGGHAQDPPCGFCAEAGHLCMVSDRGRTCAYCIATNRSAPMCEESRQNRGTDGMDYEPAAGVQSPNGSSFEKPVLTHSGRVSKRPTRDDFVDRSENDTESAVSSADENNRRSRKLRRKSSLVRTNSSLKRPRPSSVDAYEPPSIPTPAAAATTPTTGGPPSAHGSSVRLKEIMADVWFYFTPQLPRNPDSPSKMVRAGELGTMHAFFDTALKVWRTFGGDVDGRLKGVDVSWPERNMIVEWRDERDWERMMTMLRRQQGNVHGEVEVIVGYRPAKLDE